MNVVKMPVSNHSWRCIDTDGKRCPQLRTSHFGTRYMCHPFHPAALLHERDGCLERWPERVSGATEETE